MESNNLSPPQLSWNEFLQGNPDDGSARDTACLVGNASSIADLQEPIGRLRVMHDAVNKWPFPFRSSQLEREYLDFSAPAPPVPPFWSLLFLVYIATAPVPDYFGSAEWCPLNRPILRGFQWGLFSITFVAMVLQLVQLVFAWKHSQPAMRKVKEDASSDSGSTFAVELDAVGSSSLDPDLMELPGTSPAFTISSAMRASAFLRSHFVDQFGALYLLLRTVVLNCILVEAVVRDIQLWQCRAPTKFMDVALLASSVLHFAVTLMLHGSLKWDIPRFLILPLANTIIAIMTPTQSADDRLGQLLAIWIITFIFLCITWDAERESRSRFLLSKALEVMRMRSDQQKRKVALTLRSICDEDQLQMYLTGIPLRDESPCCYILILSIHDYVLWRQQNTIVAGMACVDLLQRELERQRQQYPDLSLLCVAGDETIISLGLRGLQGSNMALPQSQSEEGEADSSKELVVPVAFPSPDPSNVVLFAFQALTATRILTSRGDPVHKTSFASSIRPDAKLIARLKPMLSTLRLSIGLGMGRCQGALLPGRGAHYIVKGKATESARENARANQPGTLDLPLAVVKRSRCITVTYRRLPHIQNPHSNSEVNLVRVTSVRRKPTGISAQVLPEAVDLDSAEKVIVSDSLSSTSSPALSPNAAESPSVQRFPSVEEAWRRAEQDTETEKVTSPNKLASNEVYPGDPLTPETKIKRLPSDPSTASSCFEPFRRSLSVSWKQFQVLLQPIQEDSFYAFVDQRLLNRAHFINSCWMAMLAVFTSASLTAFTIDTTAIAIWAMTLTLASHQAALWLETMLVLRKGQKTRRPVPPPFFRWQLYFFGTLQFALMMATSLVINNRYLFSFSRQFPSLHCNLLFSVTATDGVPLLLSVPTALAFQIATAFFRPQSSIGVRFLSFLPPIILPTLKAQLIRSEYQQLVILSERKAAAESDRQAHERALNMVIPSYIASHVAKLETRGTLGVVSEVLVDVAVLVVRVPTCSMDFLLGILTELQLLCESLPEVSLIHSDGDVLMVTGPLARPSPGHGAGQPLASPKQEIHSERFLAEENANRASRSAVKVLQFLRSRFPAKSLTAVLHRGDGVAVVFRRRCPVFAVEGVVTESARSVLRQLPTGVTCITERFQKLYSLHHDDNIDSTRRSTTDEMRLSNLGASGLESIGATKRMSLRIKGVGFVTVYVT